MTIGVYGPRLPEKSGVADYIENSLLHLTKLGACTHVSNSTHIDPYAFDRVLYHLGNNNLHHCAFRALSRRPGPVIMHEYNHLNYYLESWQALSQKTRSAVSHKLQEACLIDRSFVNAKDRRALIRDLDTSAVDAHIESLALSNSTTTFVHSTIVLQQLQARYPNSPFATLPFPVSPFFRYPDDEIRAEFGIGTNDFVFGSFGFIGKYKRLEKVIEAWLTWRPRPSDARLILVGEQQYRLQLPNDDSILSLGFLGREQFNRLLASVDCGIQLRYPYLGESSGVISQLGAFSRPMILTDLPAMREYEVFPRVIFVPVNATEINDLREAFRSQYEARRIPAVYKDRYSWDKWLLCMEHLLRP